MNQSAKKSILKQLLEDEIAHSADNVAHLTQIVGELTNAGSGNTRVVMNLTTRDLTSLYLKSSGSEDILKNFSDDQLKQLIKDIKTPMESNLFLRVMPKPFTLAMQVSSKLTNAAATVLLDIPNNLVGELASTPPEANAQDIRNKLIPMMDIKKYYLMTLNTQRTKAIAASFDAAHEAGNFEECNRLFSPKMITNYPSSNTLLNAKNEWDEYYSDLSGSASKNQETTNKPDPTKPDDNFDGSQNEKDLSKLPSAQGGDILGDLTKFLFVYGATHGPVNDEAAATGLASELEKKFGPKYNKAETVRTLNSMARAFGTESGTDKIANAVMARKNWK